MTVEPAIYKDPPKQRHVQGDIAPHGTATRYVQHKCRCDPCRDAIADRTRLSTRRRAYGLVTDWEDNLVDATEARRHIKTMVKMGVPWKQFETLAGVGHTALWAIITGKRKRIFPGTADRILAVTWSDYLERGLSGNRVPAAETWRLIDELIAAGFARRWIARQLGQTTGGLQLSRESVSLRHARAVQALHDRLWAENAEGFKGHRNGPEGKLYSGIRLRQVCRCKLAEEPETRQAREYQREHRAKKSKESVA